MAQKQKDAKLFVSPHTTVTYNAEPKPIDSTLPCRFHYEGNEHAQPKSRNTPANQEQKEAMQAYWSSEMYGEICSSDILVI